MKDVGDEEEGGVSLVPSAPPAHVSLTSLLEGEGDLLSLEPPVWIPDSHASTCTRCKLPFRCSSTCCAPMARHMEPSGYLSDVGCGVKSLQQLVESIALW